jgi:hypothetical protein
MTLDKKRKYKYYQIDIYVLPEVERKLNGLLSYYTKEILKELINGEFSEIEKKVLEVDGLEFYNFKRREKILKRIYVGREFHDKWVSIPRAFKKPLQFLINKKLLSIKVKKMEEIKA